MRWMMRTVSLALLGALLLTGAACHRLPATPPVDPAADRAADLVEVDRLDPTLRLDIRYATADNFVGRQVYPEARAFLQRPAAEALLRVQQALRPEGVGLVVYDAYRPWSVTKLFWELTPKEKHDFVADPRKGSRHNRGCSVDVGLVDLATGRQIPMPSGYDEMNERAHPDYPGGPEEARRWRDWLRAAMEAEGFEVYPYEWWHYDYKDWARYPILDLPFSAFPR